MNKKQIFGIFILGLSGFPVPGVLGFTLADLFGTSNNTLNSLY